MTDQALQNSSIKLNWRIATIRNGVKEALAYRGEFLLDIFGSAIVPVGIQLMLWTAILRGDPNASFAGMSYGELMAYTWTSLLFSQIRGGDLDFSIIEMIRTGTLNNYLLRPVGVLEFVYFKGLGEKLLTLLFCFALGSIATLFTSLSLPNLLMAMMLALLGNVIAYLFGCILATVAFYWENAFAALMVKNMVVALFCGELIPLTIVPEKYSLIWKCTPFYLFVFGPTQVALGKWNSSVWLREMGLGVLWILAFLMLLHLAWKKSIHRYQGIGG
jgi:ABC-2 type transport system permease protein